MDCERLYILKVEGDWRMTSFVVELRDLGVGLLLIQGRGSRLSMDRIDRYFE